jgi:hypothetical protein
MPDVPASHRNMIPVKKASKCISESMEEATREEVTRHSWPRKKMETIDLKHRWAKSSRMMYALLTFLQVYMTPSAQIGRLIEDLSQGLDAGSFNFSLAQPADTLVHSTTSSMSDWTVEERLEHMLGAMRAS